MRRHYTYGETRSECPHVPIPDGWVTLRVPYRTACGRWLDDNVCDDVERVTCRQCVDGLFRDAPELVTRCLHTWRHRWDHQRHDVHGAIGVTP